MLLDTYSNPAGSVSTTWPNVTPEGLIVTVSLPPGRTDGGEKDLAALGPVTVTRVSPPSVVERPSWSLTVPENVCDPTDVALAM